MTTITDATASWTGKQVALGTGGWVMNVLGSDDGATVVAQTDVTCAFVYDRAADFWHNMFSHDRLPAGTIDLGVEGWAGGVYAVAPSPSNSSILYAANQGPDGGKVFKSINGGATLTLTNFNSGNSAIFAMSGNHKERDNNNVSDTDHSTRHHNGKMVVDPVNPNVVIIGLQTLPTGDHVVGDGCGGAYMTLDGGSTWTALHSLTSPLPKGSGNSAVTGIIFDRSSVSGGRCQRIWACSGGNGIYHSSDGGASWSLISTLIKRTSGVSTCPVDNYMYMASWGNNKLLRATPGTSTLTDITPGTSPAHSVSAHPTVAGRVVVVSDAGDVGISYNATSGSPTWTWHQTTNRKSPQIPWLKQDRANEFYMSHGGSWIDPVTGHLWIGEGIGVWKSDNPVPSSGQMPAHFTSMTRGIEALITEVPCVVTPNDRLLYVCQDRRGFVRRMDELHRYPGRYIQVDTGVAISHGASIDFAGSDPNFIVMITDKGAGSEDSCYSPDGGITWYPIPTIPSDWDSMIHGGTIAVSTPLNWIWQPTNTQSDRPTRIPHYTLDGGNTWTAISLSGITTTEYGFTHYGYYFKRKVLAASRTTPGKFLYYFYEQTGKAGAFRTLDGGATWTRRSTGYLSGSSTDAFNGKLKSVPGKPNDWWWTVGHGAETIQLVRSLDDGATWTPIPNVYGVHDIDFGAVAPGATYPRTWIHGCVGGIGTTYFGLYYSDNADAADPSWTKVTTTGVLEAGTQHRTTDHRPMVVAASPNEINRVVIGCDNSGLMQMYLAASPPTEKTTLRLK